MKRRRAGKKHPGQQSRRRFGFQRFLDDERAKLDLAAGGEHVFAKGQYAPWRREMSGAFRDLAPEVRQNYGTELRIRRTSRQGQRELVEKIHERDVDESVTSEGWGMQSSRRPLALPTFSSLLEEVTSSTSLRSMAEDMEAFAMEKLGKRSISNYTVDPNSMPEFDTKKVSATRKAEKTCDEKHLGVCSSHPRIGNIKKVARNLFL